MYKLVPVEATEEMASIAAMVIEAERYNKEPDDLARLIYGAMLEAAPNPWRPIAEAPKDGAYILARPGEWLSGVRPAIVVRWKSLDEGWSEPGGCYGDRAFDEFIPLEWLESPEWK